MKPVRLCLACGMTSLALSAVAADPVDAASAAAAPVVRLEPGAVLGPLPRFGVNLGRRTAWGADQLMANVLRNPGLEAVHDGALLVLGRVLAHSVVDDTQWTARPEGFWTGARYEVLSGAAAGQAGTITDDHPSRGAPNPGESRPAVEYGLDPMPAGLQPGDVIAIEGTQDVTAAPLWWTQGSVRMAQGDVPPGSPGRQSARLLAVPGKPAALIHHLDTLASRAGKLLPVRGRWRLSLWLKAVSSDAEVQVRFARQGSRAWVDRSVKPTAGWQPVNVEFDATDDGLAGPLQFTVSVSKGEVLVDDLYLGEADPAPGGFRRAVLETLQALRPGYLRDWQGQLADTPANRRAAPLARRPVRYRPGAEEIQFNYSLDEFFALSAAVGARPWVVLPSTSTPAQAREFGRVLAEQWRQHRVDEIVVEHGNEHWNSMFRAAGISSLPVLASVTDRAFAALREGAGPGVPLHLVAGTQYVRDGAAPQLGRLSRQISGVAVAPYFLHKLDRIDSVDAGLDRALGDPGTMLATSRRALQALGKSLDVYEVNFHTTGGDASPEVRNGVVTSAAAGPALVRRLMQGAAAGVTRQAVYTLASFDTYAEGPARELVRLFGITRDLAGPEHWRSTGLALAQLNAVAGGAAQAGQCEGGAACADITSLSFDGARRWAVVSGGRQPVTVQWRCVSEQAVGWLDGSDPRRREDGEPVTWRTQKLPCTGGMAQFVLPGRSLLTARTSSGR